MFKRSEITKASFFYKHYYCIHRGKIYSLSCLIQSGTSRSLLSCPTLDENLDYKNILESTKKVLHPMLHFLLNVVSACKVGQKHLAVDLSKVRIFLLVSYGFTLKRQLIYTCRIGAIFVHYCNNQLFSAI
jgi:hypothetical protein